MEPYVRKIGSEKKQSFENNFDKLIEEYKSKAEGLGFEPNLKFKIEKGKVIIFVVIE